MRQMVVEQRLGYVASVCSDGTANLSPQGTVAVWDDRHLVFAHIHSHQTVANIEAGHVVVEVNVVDPIRRNGYRFKGPAEVHREGDLYDAGAEFFQRRSGLDRRRIRAIVLIRVERAAAVLSPSYDDGSSEADIEQRFLALYGLRRAEPQAGGEDGGADASATGALDADHTGLGIAVPVRGLFETHLTVTDLERSMTFYREVVGLQVALEVPERGAAFHWIGRPGQAMLGLWSIGSAPVGMQLHIAFEMSLPDVLAAPEQLAAQGIQPLSFFAEPADEPSVIGWMPAAAVYFRDPDGHLIEYLAMLEGPARPELGIVPWSRRAG